MTRKEFSTQLSDIRKSSGVKIKDICMSLNVLPDAIYRMEGGKFNYDTNRMLAYCNALGIKVVLNGITVTDYDSLLSTTVKIRKAAEFTQRSLAEVVGISRQAVVYIETQKNTLTIDVLLKICEVAGATILLNRKEVSN